MKKLIKMITLFVFIISSSLIVYSQEPNETLTDIDGNTYKTVKIGDQIWMAENLKTTKYNTGAPIRRITSVGVWSTTQDATYCWYDDDELNKEFYGALYSWGAVNKGNLAPKGWHIPCFEEWQALIDYLGGKKIAGNKLKITGTDYWDKPNAFADNIIGFTAMPNGRMDHRDGSLVFKEMGTYSYLWASTYKKGVFGGGTYVMIPSDEWAKAYRASIVHGVSTFDQNLGVRCIKD